MHDSRRVIRSLRSVTLLLSLMLVGCSTTQSRIAQHQSAFDQLTTEQREMVMKGQIDIGFTPAMVYMALGSPHRKIQQKTMDGESTGWVYLQTKTEFFTMDYSGTLRCTHGRSTIEPLTGTRQVPYEAARIRFVKDRVSSIETQVR